MQMDLPRNSADGGTVITRGGKDGPVAGGREKALSWIKRKCRFWLGSCRPSRLRQSETARAKGLRLVRGYNRVGRIAGCVVNQPML